MGKQPASGADAERLAHYEALVGSIPGIELKGKSMPYTSCNGHMFSFLSADGTLAIRLPESERTLFLSEQNAALMEAHGTIMKEYVAVPKGMLEQPERLKSYLQKSYEYVRSLKPKPTKKARS